jgi:hypothetical protein
LKSRGFQPFESLRRLIERPELARGGCEWRFNGHQLSMLPSHKILAG